MPDEQKKDQAPGAFDDAAERSVEAGIADETAAYDTAMENGAMKDGAKEDGAKPTSSDRPSADEMGDFA